MPEQPKFSEDQPRESAGFFPQSFSDPFSKPRESAFVPQARPDPPVRSFAAVPAVPEPQVNKYLGSR